MALKRSRNCLPFARTMIEAAAFLYAGELQFFDRVDDLMQVLLGQVQIPGCHLQILMAEQKLNGAQVGTGFQ